VLAVVAAREVGAVDAEDVVQDALVRAWRRRETFDPDRGSVRAWLLAVLLDQARRHRVRLWSARPRLVVDATVTDDPAGHRLDVEHAVRNLPSRQRQVVTLHYLADLPVAEVAGVLAISESTVKSELFDARARLRKVLERS
jgi:RNA polymerase sigma-70 factor, ECF subfamily